MKNILIKGLYVSACVLSITSSVSAFTCTNLTKPLSRGIENTEVLSLQQFLFESKYLPVKPSGYFGPVTVSAIKSFQLANGLSPVGSVGPATRGKVKEVSCGNASIKINSLESNKVEGATTKKTPEYYLDYEIDENNITIVQSKATSTLGEEVMFTWKSTKPTVCSFYTDNDSHYTGPTYSLSQTKSIQLTAIGTYDIAALCIYQEGGKKVSSKSIKHTVFKDKNSVSQGSIVQQFALTTSTNDEPAISRNKDRLSNSYQILNALTQYSVDKKGLFPSALSSSVPTELCSTTGPSCSGMVDLGVLLGVYVTKFPKDPSATTINGTGYFVSKDKNSRVTVSAPFAEMGKTVSVTR